VILPLITRDTLTAQYDEINNSVKIWYDNFRAKHPTFRWCWYPGGGSNPRLSVYHTGAWLPLLLINSVHGPPTPVYVLSNGTVRAHGIVLEDTGDYACITWELEIIPSETGQVLLYTTTGANTLWSGNMAGILPEQISYPTFGDAGINTITTTTLYDWWVTNYRYTEGNDSKPVLFVKSVLANNMSNYIFRGPTPTEDAFKVVNVPTDTQSVEVLVTDDTNIPFDVTGHVKLLSCSLSVTWNYKF
jgi:hypothetical protein